jgi:hypothetical protein
MDLPSWGPPRNRLKKAQLEKLAKRLLATPHKPREESKLGKSKMKRKASPKRRKPSAASAKRIIVNQFILRPWGRRLLLNSRSDPMFSIN